MGLEEKKSKDSSDKLGLRRCKKPDPNSFIEMILDKLKTKGISKDAENVLNIKINTYNEDDIYFSIALELSTTWINRILFLKLLESQLLNYHKIDEKDKYSFFK